MCKEDDNLSVWNKFSEIPHTEHSQEHTQKIQSAGRLRGSRHRSSKEGRQEVTARLHTCIQLFFALHKELQHFVKQPLMMMMNPRGIRAWKQLVEPNNKAMQLYFQTSAGEGVEGYEVPACRNKSWIR